MQPKEKHECEQQKKPDKYERLSKYKYRLFNIEHMSSTYYVENRKKKHLSFTVTTYNIEKLKRIDLVTYITKIDLLFSLYIRLKFQN